MKLKYFLRGLGSGIALTAVVTALTAKPQLSDAKIIERASQLGMVSKEEAELNEDDLSDLSTDEDEEEESDEEDHEDKDKSNDIDKKEEDKQAKETSKETDSKDVITVDAIDNEKKELDDQDKNNMSKNMKPKNTKNIQFTIKSGLHSLEVSNVLEAAGVIDNAKKFDEYLIQYGYQRRIIPGLYETSENNSYESVAKLITK